MNVCEACNQALIVHAQDHGTLRRFGWWTIEMVDHMVPHRCTYDSLTFCGLALQEEPHPDVADAEIGTTWSA